ncbi:chaperonin Cpn60/TCP-1 family [Suillus ampliporus]|nr:chaperonin Cpn60/TCP-1 family [Suillus ampliporus]
MSLKVPKANNIQLFRPRDGYNHIQGIDDTVLQNIQAVFELSDLVRTSFSPNSQNKLIINHLGRLFVTSDAATIIREVEVVHPAAKLLVMASQAQESEVGDSTNMVITLAGDHPNEVIKGYELACAEGLAELESDAHLSTSNLPSPFTQESLTVALKATIASKQYGYEDNPKNFNVDNVRVVKIMGSSLSGSEPELSNAKVAVFTSALDVAQTETKGTVLIKNADEMLNFTRGEEQHLEKIFKEITDSGIKVIIAGSSVGDLTLHYFSRFNIAVLKVLSKFDLRRVARVVNATPLARIGVPTPEEAGYVDIFKTTDIGGDRVTVLRQLALGEEGYSGHTEKTRTATIVLRGATANYLDDLEHAIDDGVNVIKSLIKDPRLVPGADTTELELRTCGLAQHAMKRYATALEVIPRTLAENALGGAEGNEVLSRLWAKHEQKGGAAWGVDVEAEEDGTLLATDCKILDSLAAKQWAIKLATEAAVSVLSVDSIIMSKPAGGPKVPQQASNWDEDQDRTSRVRKMNEVKKKLVMSASTNNIYCGECGTVHCS